MKSPYKLVPYGVFRIADNASIPNDVENRDWREYQAWLAAGNTPDPADAPPPPPPAMIDARLWLERLPLAKQIAVVTVAASNPVLQLWLLKAAGAQAGIDVTLQDTKDGVAALVAAGVLTVADQTVLLTP